jgi:hypothetical protein
MSDETVVKVEHPDGPTAAQEVAAHSAAQGHKYVMHFPAHPARKNDPHYVDFNAYHRKHHDTATCYVGDRIGADQCSDGPLELHHAHIEFSLQNGVDLAALEVDYPGISNPDEVGVWIESEQNFRWLCAFHHRGHAGAHTSAHADWEAGQYMRGLFGAADDHAAKKAKTP